ncbi:MAG: membrane protein of unknown function [Candidatus Thorarchaeota archaeon]|nr:MAG: membrane protein of unknown function [Candidatus Thorarchaeota archaeon]
MDDHRTVRAARLADLLLAVLRFIILVIIVPLAVLLATFFITVPIISDYSIRMLVSLSVGVMLAGLLLNRINHRYIGSVAVLAGSGMACIAAYMTISSFATIALGLHVLLGMTLVVSTSLNRNENLTESTWLNIQKGLGILIVLTGPLFVYILTFNLFSPLHSVFLALITLSAYLLITQVVLRNKILGPIISVILSVGLGLILVEQSRVLYPMIDLLLYLSVFSMGTGLSLLATTRILRRFQLRVISQIPMTPPIVSNSSLVKEGNFEPHAETHTTKEDPLHIKMEAAEWIIDVELAQILAAFGLLLIALGTPTVFIFLTSQTSWGLVSQFIPLFAPLSIMISLLILMPFPVYLRLGGTLKRSFEGIIVRIFGTMVVITAALSLYLWTQFYLFPIALSISFSSMTFLAGITGLFKRVRRVFRTIWESFTNAFRRMKYWVKQHILISGTALNVIFTGTIAYLLYPLFLSFNHPFMGLAALSGVIFAGCGTLGVGALTKLKRRGQLLSIGSVCFLASLSALILWYLIGPIAMNIGEALPIALLLMLATSALQKNGVSLRKTSIPYLPGFVGGLWISWNIQATYLSIISPLVIIVALVLLPIPVAHPGYIRVGHILIGAGIRFGRWIHAGLILVGNKIKNGVVRIISVIRRGLGWIGSTIKNGFTKAGKVAYDAAVVAGQILLKFIFISWAVFSIFLCLSLGYGVLIPYLGMSFIPTAFVLGCCFFILYLGMLVKIDRPSPILTQASVVGLSIATGGLVYTYVALVNPISQILIASISSMGILLLGRNEFSESISTALPVIGYSLILAAVTNEFYLLVSPLMSTIHAILLTSIASGIGATGYRVIGLPKRVVGGMYIGLSAIPAVLFTYMITLDLILSGLVCILAPIPYAYSLYIRTLQTIGTTILVGIKQIVKFINRNAVPFFGAVFFGLTYYVASSTYTSLLQMGFDILIIGSLYMVLFTILWIPILHIKKEQYPSLLTGVFLLFVGTISFEIITYMNPPDPIVAILGWVCLVSLFSMLGSSEIHISGSVIPAFIATITASTVLGIYLLPIDILSKIILLSIETILLGAFFVPREKRIIVSYTLVITLTLAVIFWNLLSILRDPVLVGLGFLVFEMASLSMPKELRKSYTWWGFSILVGLGMYYLLQGFGIFAVLASVLVVSELIRITPSKDNDLSNLSIAFSLVRSSILAVGTGLLILPVSLVLSIEVAAFVFILMNLLSIWSELSDLILVGSINGVAILSSIAIFHFFYDILLAPFGISLYISAIPVLLILLDVSLVEKYHTIGWGLFGITLSTLVSLVWYLLGISSSPILFITTWTTTFLLTQIRPIGQDMKSGIVVQSFVVSSIIWLESIWISYSYPILPFTGVVAGAAGLSLLSLFGLYLHSVKWENFSHIWEIQTGITSILLAAYITGWEYTTLIPPANISGTLGVSLFLMSLLTTPVFLKYESQLRTHSNSSAGHMTLLPGIAGAALLTYSAGSYLEWNPIFGLFATSAVLCIGSGLYYLTLPEQPSWMPSALNLGFASSMAGLFWLARFSLEPVSYAIWTFAFWYILAIPSLIDPTIRFIEHSADFIRRNIFFFSSTIPPILGILIATALFSNTSGGLVLGLNIRSTIGFIATIYLITGILYLVANTILSLEDGIRLRTPSGVLFVFGLYQAILYFVIPDIFTDILSLGYQVGAVVVLSCVISYPVFSFNHLESMKKTAHWLISFTLIPTVSIGTLLFTTINIAYSIIAGLVVGLMVMAPLIPNQIQRIINVVKNLGSLLGQLLRDFTGTLRYLFDRFGYIMWGVFSSAFTITIAVFSFPFFSELVAMPPTGSLYVVPSISLPMSILGMMLLVIAIIRRQVKTSFGSVSLFLISIGLGATTASWLTEYGEFLLAGSLGILALSIAGLVVISEADKTQKWRTIFWVPIPAALGVILLDRLLIAAVTLDIQILVFTLSVLATSVLYTISTSLGYLPKKLGNPLWITKSISLGVIVYIASQLATFSLVASGYLTIVMASIVLFPVIGKDSKYVFFSLLFFGVTGFAYTSVFGIFLQSLMLALAVSFLFFALFIREKEKDNPNLVYLRLVVLIALVASIAIFGGTIALGLMVS